MIATSANLKSAEISSPTLFMKQDFDVLHYDANIEFSSSQRRLIYATNEITIHWVKRTDTSKFYFHLRNLSVDKVEYNGKHIDFLQVGKPEDATYHFAVLPPADDKKDTAKVKVYYHGLMQNEGGMNPWGGVHDKGAIFALGVGFYCNYVSTTQHWLACYDHPSDKATFEFKFIDPVSGFIISNGNYTKIEENKKSIFIFKSDKPIATYLMTFADFSYSEHTIDYKLPIKIYAPEKYSNSIGQVFRNVPKMVDIYEEMFGAYPFDIIGYVLTPIGSMESQMMINLDEKVVENAAKFGDSLNLTIAHELSHQWFGNSVTPYDYRDAYLNEAWATYCESLLLEKFFDKTYYLKEQGKKINSYIKQIAPYEGHLPLYNFSRKSPSSNYPGTIYYKGAAVLSMLRFLITNGDSTKDEVFFDFVKDYLNTYKYGNVSTDNFINTILKYHTDTISVVKFFDNWVYKIGYPQFDVALVRNNNATQSKYQDIKLRQNQPKSWGIFEQIPVPLTFVLGSMKSDTVVWLTNKFNLEESIAELVKKEKILFDTVFINSGNLLRSLLTINKIEVVNANNLGESDEKAKFSVNYKILSITLEKEITGANILLYDLYGRLVSKEVNQSNKLIKIDLNNLPSGFYNFVIMKEGNVIYKNKFILN